MVIIPDDRREIASLFEKYSAVFKSMERQETDADPEANCSPACRKLLKSLSERTRHQLLYGVRLRYPNKDLGDMVHARGTEAHVGRIVLTLIKENVLAFPSSLRVRALLIDDKNTDAVVKFWWDGIVSHMLQDRRGKSPALGTRFDDDALACERLAASLREKDVRVLKGKQGLTLKGLAKATGESVSTIRKASKQPGVIRPGWGEHGFTFSPDAVHRIAYVRGKSDRCYPEKRRKWIEVLTKIGKRSIDEPPRAVKKNRTV